MKWINLIPDFIKVIISHLPRGSASFTPLFIFPAIVFFVYPLDLTAQLTVSVRYVNDLSAGYDAGADTYRSEWIREVLDGASHREIEASSGLAFSERIQIPQVATEDGQRNCPSVTVTVPKQGIVALRWTVVGPHPITGQKSTLKTVTKPFKSLVYRRGPGNNCFPQRRPIAVTNEETHFRASLSTATRTSVPANYIIRVEAINSSGRAVYTGESKAVIIPRHVPLVVSVGDSYASGEGNPDRRGQTKGTGGCRTKTSYMIARDLKPEMRRQPVWLEPEDHRSLSSAPARAVRILLREYPYITFLSFAKSGAEVSSDEPNDLLEQLAKVKKLIGNHRIDALLMSIGGNDVRFSPTLKNLTRNLVIPTTREQETMIENGITTLTTELYPKVNENISRLGLNINKILITEYPGSLFNDRNNEPRKGCGVFLLSNYTPTLEINVGEARFIHRMGLRLNEVVAQAAKDHSWHLVDGIDEVFRGHGYCSGQSWFVFAEDSCLQQGDFRGTMHPNAEGTRQIALLIARDLRSVLPKPQTGQTAVYPR